MIIIIAPDARIIVGVVFLVMNISPENISHITLIMQTVKGENIREVKAGKKYKLVNVYHSWLRKTEI